MIQQRGEQDPEHPDLNSQQTCSDADSTSGPSEQATQRASRKMGVDKLLFSFKGRIGIGAFWLGHLYLLVAIATLILLHQLTWASGEVSGAQALFICGSGSMSIWALIALHAKRWQDIGKHAHWALVLLFCPGFGLMASMIILGFLPGTPGPNAFGADLLRPPRSTAEDLEFMAEAAESTPPPEPEHSTHTPATPPEATPAQLEPPPVPGPAGTLGKLMRRWRGPRCCLEEPAKEWIEQTFLWFKDQFGVAPLRQPTLTPSSELLPKSWHGTEQDGVELVHRLCNHMGVEPRRLQVFYYSQEEQPALQHVPLYEGHSSGPAGLFIDRDNADHFWLGLEIAGLRRPNVLVATICHELAHGRLLGERRLSAQEPSHELATDLLTVYFGTGIFSANSAIQFEQWTDGNYSGWRIGRSGYMTEPMLGYALAAYAWARGEQSPPWAKHLRDNIVPYFEEDLYYLFQTKKTILPLDMK